MDMNDRKNVYIDFLKENDLWVSEDKHKKEIEFFLEETDSEKVAEMITDYFMEWGDRLDVTIIWNYNNKELERRVGIEPIPDMSIELIKLYQRWTRDLELSDVFEEEEKEKYIWFNAAINGYETMESIDFDVVDDFIDILRQKIKFENDLFRKNQELPKTLEERVYNIVMYWL